MDSENSKRMIVIVGDGNKLCRFIANRFVERGIHIMMLINSEITPDNQIDGYHESIEISTFKDVRDLENIATTIFEKCRKIDCLICCMLQQNKMGYGEPIDVTTTSLWQNQKTHGINHLFDLSRTILKKMSECGGGRFITIGSVSGVIPVKGQYSVSATSASAFQIMKTIAVDTAGYNICANAVALGLIDESMDVVSIPNDPNLIKHIPMNRACTPKEIEETVYFASISCPEYMTGNVFVLDGGFSCSFLRDW